MVTNLTEGIPPSDENTLAAGFTRPWTDAEQAMRDELRAIAPDPGTDTPADPAPPETDPAFSNNPLQAELYRPWLEQEEARQDKQAKWRAAQGAKLDHAMLDWKAATAGKTIALDFAEDPDTARRQALVESYLFIENEGREFRSRAERDGLRSRIAYASFGGRGADDDDAFFTEIEKISHTRDARAKLLRKLQDEVSFATLSEIAGQAPQLTDARWLESLRQDPGYEPGDDGRYLEVRNEIVSSTRDHFSPIASQIHSQWQAMLAGGDLDVGGLGDFLADEDLRIRLLDSISILARKLPKEQQATFLSNLRKQSGRDFSRIGKVIGDFLADPMDREDPLPPDYMAMYEWNTENPDYPRIRFEQDKERARNFLHDLEEIVQLQYDPVKPLSQPGSRMEAFETGIYAAPGALGTTIVAATPYLGRVLSYELIREESYHSTRKQLIPALGRQEAARIAGQIAPVSAALQLPMELFGAKGLGKKIPGVSDAVERLTSTMATRFAGRVIAGGIVEGSTESLQALVDPLLIDIGHAIDPKIPATQWLNGKDGVFDAYDRKLITTFTSVAPLAFLGAGRGAFRDAKLQAFARASETELLATGLQPQDITALKSARGLFEMDRVLSEAWTRIDPRCESARSAQATLEKNFRDQQAAITAARDAGIMPNFVPAGDGFAVIDPRSGEEIGRATDIPGAMRLAGVHLDSTDELRANHAAYLASTLEIARSIQAKTDTPNRRSETIFRPGETITAAQQAALSPRDEAQVLAELKLREQMDGSASFSDVVFGQSVMEAKENIRHFTNTLNAGATGATAIHEYGHVFLNDAIAAGRMTLQEAMEAMRAFQTAAFAGRRMRPGRRRAGDARQEGRTLNYLPESEADAVAIGEAVGEFMESETLRRGKTSGKLGLDPAIVSRNLTAASKLAPGAVKKFSAFMRAVREFFGLGYQLAFATQKAIHEGRLDEAKIDDFVSKLIGLDGYASPGATKLDQTGASVGAEAAVAFSLGRSPTPLQMPDAVIAHPLGVVTGHPDYAAAKGGDLDAADRLAHDLVTPEMVEAVRAQIGDRKPIILPVLAIEQAGRNRIPQAVGWKLSQALGLDFSSKITQSIRANRGGATGLDRVFISSNFKGHVIPGAEYLAVDDTLTQGGTFAGIADHLRRNGATLIGEVALTGKQYSRTLTLSHETLRSVRQRLGDLEPAFRDATGHGFDALTESEGRTLATWKPLDAVRTRILAERHARVGGRIASSLGDATGEGRLHLEPVPGTSDQGRGEGHEVDSSRDGSPAGADPGSARNHRPRPGEPAEDGIRDPGRILESLVPGEGGSSRRPDAGKRRKSGREVLPAAGLLAWAQHHGRLLSARAFAKSARADVSRGGEHLVYFLPEGDRVLKLTKPGLFGAQGEDAGAYLRRWAFHNRAFGDDTAFEGFVTLEGEDLPRAVISQRYAAGRDATAEELADYLVGKGFHEMPDGKWIHPIRGYELWDTITPGNAIMTAEGVRVIDLQLGPADPVALEELRERSGIGRKTAFSLGPARMAEILSSLEALPKVMRDVRGSDQVKAVKDEFLGEPLINLATGMMATVSGGSLHKMLSSSAVLRSASPQAHMMALGNIDHLFRLAILEQTRDGKKDIDENRIAGIHHLIAPLPFEDQVLEVRIMAKEFLNPDYGSRLYLIQAAEIVTPASLTGEASSPKDEREPHRPAGVGEIFARMVEAVKKGARRD